MLPLREIRPRPSTSTPVVVWALVTANVFVFLAEQALSLLGLDRAVLEWSFVPQVLSKVDPLHGLLTVFSSMFMHAGWFHLAGNLWFLFFFGRAVEEALGHRRFAVLYLASGVAAALAQFAIDTASPIPMVGASGAIGGVLASYVSLHPRRRIVTVVPILFIPLLFELPAFLFVVEWFAMNLLRGLGALTVHAKGGVAWFAHLGGFVTGLVLVRAIFPGQTRGRRVRRPHRPSLDVEVRAPSGRRYVSSTVWPK